MKARATMVWAGLVGGAILLGRPGSCLAETDAAAAAGDSGNPYSVIIDRNVFRLNPPPPPAPPNTGPPPDLPVVNLSGFIKTADEWKVLLAVKIKTGDAKAPESTSYLTMSEGDKSEVVELVKMYPDEEKVDIINSGTPMTLSMKDNGFSSQAAAPAPGGRGGPAAIRPIGVPQPTPQPGIPGAGAVVPMEGQGAGEGNPIVGGASFNRGGFNNPSSFGGGAMANTGGFQPQQAAYQAGGFNARTGSGVISGGGAAFNVPAPQPATTVPLGQNNSLSHLSQPNSTPVGPISNPNVEMPPMPGVNPNQPNQ